MIAFFPGKFHPPHIGHVQTILNIISEYDKVIVGVTEDIPEDNAVTEPDKIVEVLTAFFNHFKNVSVYKVKGVLTKKNNLSGLPEFDILLSGNPDVLLWAKKMNVPSKFVPRSEGILFEGTKIRSIMKEEK